MPKPVVTLVQYSGKRDGAALSALAIGEGFLKRGCKLQMIFGTTGEAFQLSRQFGYDTYLWEHKNWLRDQRLIGFVKNYFQESKRSRQLLEILRNNHTDLVYINTIASLGAAKAAFHSRLPCVWHFREQFQEHGGELRAPGLIKPFLPFIWKRFAKTFVFNTQTAKDSMYGSRIGGKVIPVGINDAFGQEHVSRDDCRMDLKLPTQANIIGIPGGLRRVKGHDWFIKSTCDWLKATPNLHVALAGAGSIEITKTLKQLVSGFGLIERVHFLGSVKDMSTFYHACNLICIPSRGESFGRCAVEAMACRVPLVASAVGGLKELIQHGQNGLLVTYQDAQGLVDALKQILINKDQTAKMIDQAYRDFRARYTESAYQQSICDYVFKVWQPSKS